MKSIHGLVNCVAWMFLMWTPAARSDEPAACAPESRFQLDLPTWRQHLLKAGRDQSGISRTLEGIGFPLDHFQCLPEGKIVAVDIFPATFGAKQDADRIVQVRTRGCILERDLIVLTAQPDSKWCVVGGQLDTGNENACGIEPYTLQLIHLTDPHHHTLQVTYSDNSTATAYKRDGTYERFCDKHRNTSFWDVQDNTLVLRLRLDAGPVSMSGKYPKVVRARDEQQMTTFRFDGTKYTSKEEP